MSFIGSDNLNNKNSKMFYISNEDSYNNCPMIWYRLLEKNWAELTPRESVSHNCQFHYQYII
jgi:hypothetical protein